MQYQSRLAAEKRAKDIESLLTMWTESVSYDEFKLKVATAGIDMSLMARTAFYTWWLKKEHFTFFTIASVVISLLLVAIPCISGAFGSLPMVLATTLVIGVSGAIFIEKQEKWHTKIARAEGDSSFSISF